MTKYIYDLKDYKSKSERILGFKKPAQVGLKTPDPLKVITHIAFEEYKKKKKPFKEASVRDRRGF